MGEDQITITKRQLRAALTDVSKSAEIVNLEYTSDAEIGIHREKKGNKFEYTFQGKKIKDTELLLRIKSIGIPPAWTNVWICMSDNGHLQATGYDTAGRKQYRYHPMWNKIRNHTKFFRLLNFGLKLNEIRLRINQDLNLPDISKNKVLATVVNILDSAYIRIGNSVYEKTNGSFGLTTLKDKHVKFEGSKINFCFIGKKGIKANITIKNKRLANIIKKCKDIPGQHLLAYYENGEIKKIDSGMVNDYIREISGENYTSKDFRTWAGSTAAIRALIELGESETAAGTKKIINQMFDIVASELGNTRNVCRQHYVHPIITELYESRKLNQYIKMNEMDDLKNLKPEEIILINILQKITLKS